MASVTYEREQAAARQRLASLLILRGALGRRIEAWASTATSGDASYEAGRMAGLREAVELVQRQINTLCKSYELGAW